MPADDRRALPADPFTLCDLAIRAAEDRGLLIRDGQWQVLVPGVEPFTLIDLRDPRSPQPAPRVRRGLNLYHVAAIVALIGPSVVAVALILWGAR